jgi:hypothetical protein
MANWNLVQCVIDRSLISPNEDVAVVTMHIRPKLALLPDDTIPMTDTLRDDFKAKLDTFWTGVTAFMHTSHVVKQYRMYDIPSTRGLLGAPKKVYTVNIPGASSAGPLPTQVACSVTWKTAQRKTWGRFYLPGFVQTKVNTSARFSSGDCTSLANLAAPLASRSGTGACLTVFSTKEWTHHDPQTVQVDDVPDVIRRRRLSFTVNRGLATIS